MPSIIAGDGDQEGLGLVAAESLACGCITLVSRLEAIADIHTVEALQFDMANVDSLHATLCYAYENQQEAYVSCCQLRQAVVNNFDWQNIGNRYTALMLDILQSH
jgi:glycosyltransferase involved in cell wall biosynthesis